MAYSSSPLGMGPPQFTRENYHIWEIKIRVYLKALNLWEIVKDRIDPPSFGSGSYVDANKGS